MPRVVLTAWKPGLDKVQLTKLLRGQSGMSLAEAHDSVGRLLAGERVVVELPTTEAAERLAAEASRVGAIVEVEYPEEAERVRAR